jgi:hypothetical protein
MHGTEQEGRTRSEVKMKIQVVKSWHWKIIKHPFLNVWFWGMWMFSSKNMVKNK